MRASLWASTASDVRTTIFLILVQRNELFYNAYVHRWVGVIKSGMDYNLSVKGFAYSPTYLEVGLLLT